MGWTTPKTWAAGSVISASDMNAHVRDNEKYLHAEFPFQSVSSIGTVDWTTGGTAWVNAGTTLSMTLYGGRAAVQAHLQTANFTGGTVALNLVANGTVYATGNGTIDLYRAAPGNQKDVSLTAVFTGLPVGSNTFQVVVRNAGTAGTATVYNNGYAINLMGWGY